MYYFIIEMVIFLDKEHRSTGALQHRFVQILFLDTLKDEYHFVQNCIFWHTER